MKTKPAVFNQDPTNKLFQQASNALTAFVSSTSSFSRILKAVWVSKRLYESEDVLNIEMVLTGEEIYAHGLLIKTKRSEVTPLVLLRALQANRNEFQLNQLDRYDLTCILADFHAMQYEHGVRWMLYASIDSATFAADNELDDKIYYVFDALAALPEKIKSPFSNLAPLGELVGSFDFDTSGYSSLRATRVLPLTMRHNSPGKWGVIAFDTGDEKEVERWIQQTKGGYPNLLNLKGREDFLRPHYTINFGGS